MSNDDAAFLSAAELGRHYRKKSLSPVEAAEAVFRQIVRHNETYNAFCLVDEDAAMGQARASEQRFATDQPLGPVDGIPTAIKDIYLTKGWPTLRGSQLVDPDQPWEIDAPAVAALREGGAVLTGKTTTPELGWKGVTDSPLHGATGNPWDATRTAGGSSGGSGVAVAMGMGPLATGTDGGGSIRIPASFCGISGIKPTYGMVPHWPVSPYGTLAHAGPMARTIVDVAIMLRVMTRPDTRDWLALPPQRDSNLLPRVDLGKLRIAYSPALGHADVQPGVRAAVDSAAKSFAEMGAAVEQVDPGFADPLEMYETLWYAGAAQATRYFGRDEQAMMDPGLVEIIEQGNGYSAVEYVEANSQRGQLGVLMNKFHETYDLLLTPSMPISPFTAGREVPEGWPHRRWPTWSPFSYPFNLTQQPAASVPCGFDEQGLPVGLQIVGTKYADGLVLGAAQAFQEAHPEHLRWPGAV